MGKLTTSRTGVPSAGPRRLGMLFLGMVLAASAAAQPAANSATSTVPPVNNGRKVTAAEPAPTEAVPASVVRSRDMGPAELGPYLESLSSVFLIRSRGRDPFGQNQDPDAKPEVKPSAPSAVRRATPAQATPFSEIVRLLVVTTIMPGEKRFLVGARSFKQGDVLPLRYRNKQIRAMITEVTSRQISFRNLDTGEVAARKLVERPAGMNPGTKGITAPGMVEDRANAPIDLEPSDPPSSTFTN